MCDALLQTASIRQNIFPGCVGGELRCPTRLLFAGECCAEHIIGDSPGVDLGSDGECSRMVLCVVYVQVTPEAVRCQPSAEFCRNFERHGGDGGGK